MNLSRIIHDHVVICITNSFHVHMLTKTGVLPWSYHKCRSIPSFRDHCHGIERYLAHVCCRRRSRRSDYLRRTHTGIRTDTWIEYGHTILSEIFQHWENTKIGFKHCVLVDDNNFFMSKYFLSTNKRVYLKFKMSRIEQRASENVYTSLNA